MRVFDENFEILTIFDNFWQSLKIEKTVFETGDIWDTEFMTIIVYDRKHFYGRVSQIHISMSCNGMDGTKGK